MKKLDPTSVMEALCAVEQDTRGRLMKRWEYLGLCLAGIEFRTGFRVRTMIEIGVDTGKASKHFLEYELDHLHLVDPWKLYGSYLLSGAGKTFECQSEADAKYERVLRILGSKDNVTVWRATSMEALTLLPDVDLVFVDGNHLYDYVLEDINAWQHKTVILAGHDYSWTGPRRAVEKTFPYRHVGVQRDRDSVWVAAL